MNLKFALERGQRLAGDLKKLIPADSMPIRYFRILDGKLDHGESCDCSSWTEWDTDLPWKGLDAHRWYRTTVTIPAEFDGKRVDLRLTTGREGQWDATNPQMLVYCNQKLIQGADVNHTRIRIAEPAKVGESFEIAILAYSGTVPGDLLLRAALEVTDVPTEQAYYDLSIPLDAASLLAGRSPDDARKILHPIQNALDLLDLREPYSPAYYDSLEEMRAVLREAFYTSVNPALPTVSAIGHTHIDIAWLWTVSQTREKALRSFSTVLELMEHYPDYIFMSSQPILYQFVKEQAPEQYERIKQRVAEGRWEVDGAMWLESDCNIPSGESLVRQILKGTRFFREEFGKECHSLWLPDVFGYSAALPQILKLCGIPYFMTTKISWNQQNQLPNDTFLWRGIDGTEVFVYMPTTTNAQADTGAVTFSESQNTTTYTGLINPNMALGTYQRFQNRDLTEDTLILYGYGDGGGGPTEEMLESAKRMQFGFPGIPRIQLERETDFFDRVSAIAKNPDMPTWDGELYFERHRGTYTSASRNKKFNRMSEIRYGQLETLSSIGQIFGEAYPAREISDGWDTILLNQFHDIIPGSSISEVYQTTDRQYAEILDSAEKLIRKDLSTLTGGIHTQSPGILCYNSLGFRRNTVLTLPEEAENYGGVRCGCQVSPIQRGEDGSLLAAVSDLPSAGYTTLLFENGTPVSSALPQTFDGIFSNEWYQAAFSETGELTSLIEKKTGRELIPSGQIGNRIAAYEDRPGNWDNWDIDDYYRRKPFAVACTSPLKVIEWGPVRCTLAAEWKTGRSTISQKIRLYPGSPRIDFETEADWQDSNVLLRVEFPVAVNTTRASFEIQYGNVERETTSNHSWDSAKFEVCGHKWADLSDNGGGMSLLNNCKYGYSARDGRLGLTLIKSGCYPNKDADIGHHRFTYSIFPHAGRCLDSDTIPQAYDLNVPVWTAFLPGNGDGSIPEMFSLVQCDSPHCFFEMAKKAENRDSTVLRFYENGNAPAVPTLTFGHPIQQAFRCDLLENRLEELPVKDGHQISVPLKPYEILTIEVL
ncbi:MAG: glycoside hydrolase family 38 C-terminal domain-containing protein [Candidatus Merdivicinus sp.]